MSSISKCSCQCVKDTRSAVSLTLSGIAATAILVTLVALAKLDYLPPIAYPIAGSGFVFSLVIGTLVATVRCRKPHNHVKVEETRSSANQQTTSNVTSPRSEENASVRPPLEEIMHRVDLVTVEPNAGKSHPPSDAHPFITTEFNFTLTVDGKKWTYTLQVTNFYEHNGQVHAGFLHNNNLMNIVVNQEVGRKYREDMRTWETVDQSPEVNHLNAKMWLKGYVSQDFAWYQLGGCDLGTNRSAKYFISLTNIKSTTFRIPNLTSVEHNGSLVTFTRDSSQPLINQEQIELLKKSDIIWHQELARQLENPVWDYKFETPIVSVTQRDNEVVVVTEGKKRSNN